MKERMIVDDVRDQYAGVARGELSNESTAIRSIASAFGYSEDELNQLPAEANMGLSCGNPLALAGIREGEVVADLGCGGGMDVFLAARKVGDSGRVIGIDMTAEMLKRARAGQQKLGLTNVEFHQATIDQLPLPDDSVDCVISNCVINLVPDKSAVFAEILRVLKPGGRVAISDIALKQELPADIKESVEAYVGCISGAILIDDYRRSLEQAGFTSVVVTDTGADLNAYAMATDSGCCGGGCDADAEDAAAETKEKSLHDGLAAAMQSFDANAYAASVRVHALKNSTSDSMPISPAKSQQKTMKSVEVFDKPMCCSTGVCGPDVDPVLPKFAADLDWLKGQGHQVERYNLAQQPQAFIDNKSIHQLISTAGTDCLPVVMVDGQIVSQAAYPSREDFAGWVGAAPTGQGLPVAKPDGGCCGSSGCC
ncbi:Arsenical resistance operon trans-acting repressor ArsD [Rhodopirellula maiorica SM1]|uniref:Arsenite methyltransferase n=1 Tax=Rhodopirellula maiorica SM1 TaxID=1265738 RepID=M5R784_9BACT|nr:arsenite efflux transporter metallochaperone ArsD [Rhodopirellula maiorica]EMI15260.1 Arsenical resistance operon trans-acting repressor ArsD [Rhodopirellula maiorica SM1]